MTLSELHHRFEPEGYRTLATRFEGAMIIFETEPPRRAGCSGGHVVGWGRFLREFRALPTGAVIRLRCTEFFRLEIMALYKTQYTPVG